MEKLLNPEDCKGCNEPPKWIESNEKFRLQCQTLGCRYYQVFTNAAPNKKSAIATWDQIVKAQRA